MVLEVRTELRVPIQSHKNYIFTIRNIHFQHDLITSPSRSVVFYYFLMAKPKNPSKNTDKKPTSKTGGLGLKSLVSSLFLVFNVTRPSKRFSFSSKIQSVQKAHNQFSQ
jgi:hypothetical protein